jgi:erythromycin esterase-like protein
MGRTQGEISLGQLCRERFGEAAALIGFGCHAGAVAAATHWGGDMEVQSIRPSHEGSIERLCHEAGAPAFLLDLRGDEALERELRAPRLERFIGVVYRPDTELASHYMKASLPDQFDAYVWFDETAAITPLGPEHARQGAPDTWPFGV